MNAVMWSDFITCKQMLKSQLLISAIIALAVSLPTGTVNVICPTVAVSMAVSTAVSVVALDERNGWEGFRAPACRCRARTSCAAAWASSLWSLWWPCSWACC